MSCGGDLLRDIIKAVQHAFTENSFTENFAEEIEKQICRDYGGQALYLPKIIDREERRAAILREFNGRNRKELCSKYELSKAQFYRALKGGG